MDSSGGLIAYVQLPMSGEDPSCIPLFPVGFSIIPTGPGAVNIPGVSDGCAAPLVEDGHGVAICDRNSGGLLTAGLQVHATTVPLAMLSLSSVTAINNHLCNAIRQINAAPSGGANNNAAAASAVKLISAPKQAAWWVPRLEI
ncbi:hypothetical protein Nepgr_030644 [Nepenthes gracilis]|uniref:HD-Zip IV C-terminal domain-containing protein n=1 Tax=Nepenthes gracilis TaxID=150966 RepID=A0AAD3Y6S3_NEPGR|nr:hypothetical protein Nepgr_030644 [Nepenthes gracilis]